MVSPLCLGAMNFGSPTTEVDSLAIMNRALDAGINFVDTANVYNAGESERIVENIKRNRRTANRLCLLPKSAAAWATARTTAAIPAFTS